jgi:alkanesulfonate monooxygenase
VLTPTGSGCEDAWVLCSALLPLTSRLEFLDHDERYEGTGEFLEVLRRCLAGERFDLAGRHVRVEGRP